MKLIDFNYVKFNPYFGDVNCLFGVRSLKTILERIRDETQNKNKELKN